MLFEGRIETNWFQKYFSNKSFLLSGGLGTGSKTTRPTRPPSSSSKHHAMVMIRVDRFESLGLRDD